MAKPDLGEYTIIRTLSHPEARLDALKRVCHPRSVMSLEFLAIDRGYAKYRDSSMPCFVQLYRLYTIKLDRSSPQTLPYLYTRTQE